MGRCFRGLKRRASKGGKIGARLGELFRDQLEVLGLKRDRLSLPVVPAYGGRPARGGRGVADRCGTAARPHDRRHVLRRLYYSSGPGLKRLAAVVEAIEYEGLKLAAVS
jgi:hypothetical protein